MNPKEILVIALDAEADRIAARLIERVRKELASAEAGYVPDVQPLQASLAPRFYGVGGDEMKKARTELICDWQKVDFEQVHQTALDRQPDVILCLGENPFHHRLALALKRHVRKNSGTFCNWQAAILLIELAPGNIGEAKDDDFDETINPGNDEAIARRIVSFLERQVRHFPLKAALTS